MVKYVKKMVKAMRKKPTQTLLMISIFFVFILMIFKVIRYDPKVEKLDFLKNLFGMGEETNSSSSSSTVTCTGNKVLDNGGCKTLTQYCDERNGTPNTTTFIIDDPTTWCVLNSTGIGSSTNSTGIGSSTNSTEDTEDTEDTPAPTTPTIITDWREWNLGHENRWPFEHVLSGQKTQTWQGCAAQCVTQGSPSFVFVTAQENMGDCSCYETQLTVPSPEISDNATTYMVGTKGEQVNPNVLYQCLSGDCETLTYKVRGSDHLFTGDYLINASDLYQTYVNDWVPIQYVVVTVMTKATGGWLHPYKFTLEDGIGAEIDILYTITDNMGTFNDFNTQTSAMHNVTSNGYVINYYKVIHNAQYEIGDSFTLSYDVTKTVRKVHIGNYIDSRSVDVQIQVGGQTVLVAATTSTSDGGSSHGAAIQEATFDSLGSAPLPNYLVEVTDTVLSADSYNYIDMKNSPAQTSWGPATRLHNWLFANDQFATVPLKAMYLTLWGFIAVTDV